MENAAVIRSDFDRLSAFDGGGWSHNDYYHPYLLRYLPEECSESLEIGCGTGAFARLLATRSRHVTAFDLSPEMIRIARARSADFPNIDYQAGDILEWSFPAGHFDCIASIATLHHLSLEDMLAKMKTALRPGGVLLILDLYKSKEITDYLLHAIAIPTNIAMRLIKENRLSSSEAERRAWAEHGKHDHYVHVSWIRRVCKDLLPGAMIKRHLFWRYSLVWKKPVAN